MGFISDTFGKDAGDVEIADLERLIGEKREEGPHLEYKDARILRNPEQLSQSVSSFLNAEGGLLIVGISEDDPDKANSLTARIYPKALSLADTTETKERVDQLVHTNVRADVPATITVVPVRHVDGRMAFLLDIPQGDVPPYQAADGRYYRRLNSTRYPMRHYEIADFFGRRRRPDLSVVLSVSSLEDTPPLLRITIRFVIRNRGLASARHSTFSASLTGVEEMYESSGFSRIDSLRNGVPSVQWGNDIGVIHAQGNSLSIGTVTVVLKPEAVLGLSWDLAAEDMSVKRSTGEIAIDTLRSLEKLKGRIELE